MSYNYKTYESPSVEDTYYNNEDDYFYFDFKLLVKWILLLGFSALIFFLGFGDYFIK